MAENASKVEYYGKVLIDLTEDNVAPEKMLAGTTAHDKTGKAITGTYEPPATEDLTALLDAQETKLNTLLSTLDGKAAGGGGVETCTVVLKDMDNATYLYSYFVPTYENGAFSSAHYLGNNNALNGFEITIPNVICGGNIYINASVYDTRFDGSAELINMGVERAVYKINASAGETVTFKMYGSD